MEDHSEDCCDDLTEDIQLESCVAVPDVQLSIQHIPLEMNQWHPAHDVCNGEAYVLHLHHVSYYHSLIFSFSF